MMVSFARHGTGSAAAVDYLLGERDAAGIERGHVEVLRGDPQLVADLADSRDQVWRYTAGVIAWHAGDRPTREQIRAVLDDFAGDRPVRRALVGAHAQHRQTRPARGRCRSASPPPTG